MNSFMDPMADQARHDKGIQESRAIIVILNQGLGVAAGEDGLFQNRPNNSFFTKDFSPCQTLTKPRLDITHHGIRAVAVDNVCIVGQIARNQFRNCFPQFIGIAAW